MLGAMSMALAGLLVGLGVAITARTVVEVGLSSFGIGYIIGPGLVVAGLARIRLQRMLDGRDERGGEGGSDGA
jgi:hypothetical protein